MCSLFKCCKSRVASSLALPKRDLPKMFLVSHKLQLSDIPTYGSSITSKINKQTAYIALTVDEPCPAQAETNCHILYHCVSIEESGSGCQDYIFHGYSHL